LPGKQIPDGGGGDPGYPGGLLQAGFLSQNSRNGDNLASEMIAGVPKPPASTGLSSAG
jgi:hypothetical protein